MADERFILLYTIYQILLPFVYLPLVRNPNRNFTNELRNFCLAPRRKDAEELVQRARKSYPTPLQKS